MARDRLTLAMIVGIPRLPMMIFGYGINFDMRHIRARVVDEVRTSGSRALIGDVAAGQVVDFVERRRIDGDRPVAQLLVDATRPGIDTTLRAVASASLPTQPAAAVRRLAGRAHAE